MELRPFLSCKISRALHMHCTALQLRDGGRTCGREASRTRTEMSSFHLAGLPPAELQRLCINQLRSDSHCRSGGTVSGGVCALPACMVAEEGQKQRPRRRLDIRCVPFAVI